MKSLTSFLVCCLLSLSAFAAEDRYYSIPLDQLNLDPAPNDLQARLENLQRWGPAWERGNVAVMLRGKGEAYVDRINAWTDRGERGPTRLLVRSPDEKVAGTLWLPTSDHKKSERFTFEIAREDADPANRNNFLTAKIAHYDSLLWTNPPGSSWYRFQIRDAMAQLPEEQRRGMQEERAWQNDRRDRLDTTFDLFGGGRAVAENLQLDRPLVNVQGDDPVVDVTKITGITIADINWEPLIAGKRPVLDTVSSAIPIDQHAVFFPSLAAMKRVMDLAVQQGSPVLSMVNPRSEDTQTFARYQQQLGVTLDLASQLLGDAMVNSVAMTGSDPYFGTGTDVAIIFHPRNAAALAGALRARIEAATSQADVKRDEQTIGGVRTLVARSPDRRVSSYLATIGDFVVLSNSPVQIERIASVISGTTPSLRTAKEYTFFRDRYPQSLQDESAFVILTDATIRRWCSPKWRIGESRRTRARAVLSEARARWVLERIGSEISAEKTEPARLVHDFGVLDVGDTFARSSAYGSLAFMTPISELDIKVVSESEKSAYERWRINYQRNWRWAFDPIAVSLSIADGKIAMDMTVMPLIASTDYRQFIELSRGAAIDASKLDAHDTLFHAVVAINAKGQTMQNWGNLARLFAQNIGAEPLSWIGPNAMLYMDPDPVLNELKSPALADTEEEREKIQAENQRKLMQIPIALHIQSSDNLKMAAVVTALRAFIEQTAPGTTKWETIDNDGKPYVRISPVDLDPEINELRIYYSTMGSALVVSPNETVIRNSLERRLGNAAPATNPSGVMTPHGQNMTLHVDQRIFGLATRILGTEYASELLNRSFQNLTILNEWKRLFPDQDPVLVHQQLFGVRLVCPAGGEYRWNDEHGSMESSVLGSITNPKPPEKVVMPWDNFQRGAFGITFENDGLRAKVTLEQSVKP